ncbi:MAG TPA: hypothetical protein VGE98_03020 [Thermoanaerobaculia bacterium]
MTRQNPPSESSNIPQASPVNAFTRDFLIRLDAAEEPESCAEADLVGPWTVQEVADAAGLAFAVLREWERIELGDRPFAVFDRRETALLAAAVLPSTGREPLFTLGPDADAENGGGYPVAAGGEPAGHLRDFDEGLTAALHVAAWLVRSPDSLAKLLEAAGSLALTQVGKILDRRIH